MKTVVNIIRFIVGVLFIFSGLVKANDPHGLAYKMEEFFEKWAGDGILPSLMNGLHQYALEFSVVMIVLEIVVGVAILLGQWKRFFLWLTFVLIVFFTCLTGYAALSGKIATCGCFGDCLPLTSMQSFIKDLILLAMILLLLAGSKWIKPVFSAALNVLLLLVGIVFSIGFQWYVMHYLPVVDCLPFKKGNNILELRKMPANAVPDKKEYRFIYEKDGRQNEFSVKDLPDSTWTFVSRKDVIIEKGSNNEPPIKDYILTSQSGEDTTQAVLSLDADYYLFYVKNVINTSKDWGETFNKIYSDGKQKGIPLCIVSADPEGAQQYFNQQLHLNLPILSLDATAFKTAARTNPELYLMHGPVVKKKWGKSSLSKVIKN